MIEDEIHPAEVQAENRRMKRTIRNLLDAIEADNSNGIDVSAARDELPDVVPETDQIRGPNNPGNN